MSKSYRTILTEYWQQYFPDWAIPNGYHVHHIKPKCTFEDKDDPAINHPRNLIALHPDDHVTIHKCRGDKFVNGGTLTLIAGRPQTPERKKKISETTKKQYVSGRKAVKGMLGKKMLESAKKKISEALTNKPKSEAHKEKLRQNLKGKSWRLVNGKREWFDV